MPNRSNVVKWLKKCTSFLQKLFLIHYFLCGGQARASDLVPQLVANSPTAPRHLRIVAGHLGFLGLSHKMFHRTKKYTVS